MVNWKVRFKNKVFWVAFIPAVILLIQSVCKIFGLDIDLTELQSSLLDVVDALFVCLALIGFVTDPTTKGTGDSVQALMYDEPK